MILPVFHERGSFILRHFFSWFIHLSPPPPPPSHPGAWGLESRATHLRGNGSCARTRTGRGPAGGRGGRRSAHSRGGCEGQTEAEEAHTGNWRSRPSTLHPGWKRSSRPLGQMRGRHIDTASQVPSHRFCVDDTERPPWDRAHPCPLHVTARRLLWRRMAGPSQVCGTGIIAT